MSSDQRDGYTTVGDLLLRQGGVWLGAARERVKQRGGNGCDVTWGSGDRLSPPMTIAEVEEIAAIAVAADRNNPSNPLRVERDEARATIERVRRLVATWRAHAPNGITDAPGQVEAALGEDSDSAYQRFLVEAAKDCRCCAGCYQVPCAGCTAGGVCDAMACRCDDEPVDYHDDDDGYDDEEW